MSKAPSVKKNFSYKLILTGCNYIFPLLFYPYVTRVLGPTQYGICAYVDSIISYFILFSMLGVSLLGIREISRCKDDAEKRSQVFSGILLINAFFTLLSIATLVILTFTLEKFAPYKEFLCVGVMKIIFNVVLVEWLFEGIQNFRYIAVRSVMVRMVYILLIFLFVKTQKDTFVFYILTSGVVVVNAMLNWIYSRRFVSLSFSGLKFRTYIKPILIYGFYAILLPVNTMGNMYYLGEVKTTDDVAYFNIAYKLNDMVMAVFTAFTAVMVPKLAQMIKDGEKKEIVRIANDSVSVVSLLSIPLIMLCIVYARDIVLVIAGDGFEGAIVPFQIVIATILFMGLGQIVNIQILFTLPNNKYVWIVSMVNATVGFSLILCLVPLLASVGSAISWCVTELVVLLVGYYFLRKEDYNVSMKPVFVNLLYSLIYLVPIISLYWLFNTYVENVEIAGLTIESEMFAAILSLFVTVVLFVFINLKLNRNEVVVSFVESIKSKLTLKK